MKYSLPRGQGAVETLLLMGGVLVIATIAAALLFTISHEESEAVNREIGDFTGIIQQFRNRPPNVVDIHLEVAGVSTNLAFDDDDIDCVFTLTDPDEPPDPIDSEATVVSWYVKRAGETAFSLEPTAIQNGVYSTLQDTNTIWDDMWRCKVTPASRPSATTLSYGDPRSSGDITIDTGVPLTMDAGGPYYALKNQNNRIEPPNPPSGGLPPYTYLWEIIPPINGCAFNMPVDQLNTRIRCTQGSSAGVGLQTIIQLTVTDSASSVATDTASVYTKNPSGTGTGGGGGCPFVYSYNGTGFVKEHEAVSGAPFESLETTTFDALREVENIDGKLKVRIREDFPYEISFVKDVQMFEVKAPEGVIVYPDSATGEVHTVESFSEPVSCISKNRENCAKAMQEIGDKEIYWRDLLDIDESQEDEFEDWIVMEFEKPENAKNAKLLLYAKKSKYVEILAYYWSLLGDNWANIADSLLSMEFFNDSFPKIEYDEFAFKVDVWNGSEWIEVAHNVPGNIMWDETFLAFPLPELEGDVLKIRIRDNTGMHEYDYAGIDYSEDRDVVINELEILEARANGIDYEMGSEEYVVLNEDEYLDLTFAGEGEKMQYVIALEGYYNFKVRKERSIIDFAGFLIEHIPNLGEEENYLTKTALPAIRKCPEELEEFRECLIESAGSN